MGHGHGYDGKHEKSAMDKVILNGPCMMRMGRGVVALGWLSVRDLDVNASLILIRIKADRTDPSD